VALPWSSRGVVNLLLLVTAHETQIESRLLDRRLKLHSPIGFVAETELAVVHSLEGSAEHANAVVFADRGSDHFDAPIVEFWDMARSLAWRSSETFALMMPSMRA
jgi:hypothetical protein